MLVDRADSRRLGTKWGVDPDDVLLIALNSCGLDDARSGAGRLRFRLRLDSRPHEQMYLILSLGRRSSPFKLEGNRILLDGEQVAVIDAEEADDAVLGYWRNGGKVLTLNSNARSACTGCVFCPNTLEEANDPRLALEDLNAYFSTLVGDLGTEDLAGVETVTVCTGCFRFEELALAHLRLVRQAMTGQN